MLELQRKHIGFYNSWEILPTARSETLGSPQYQICYSEINFVLFFLAGFLEEHIQSSVITCFVNLLKNSLENDNAATFVKLATHSSLITYLCCLFLFGQNPSDLFVALVQDLIYDQLQNARV